MRSIRGNYAYLFRHHFMFATKHTGFTAVAPGLLRCGGLEKAHTRLPPGFPSLAGASCKLGSFQ